MTDFSLKSLVDELAAIYEQEYNSRLVELGRKLYNTRVLPVIVSNRDKYRDEARAGFSGSYIGSLTEQEAKAMKVFLESEKITCLNLDRTDLRLVWSNDITSW
jgi:hypothetical protein